MDERRSLPRLRLLIAGILACAAFMVIGASAASAACSVNAFSISPSCFEGGDGNIVVDHGGNDWQNFSAFTNKATKDDDLGDSQFGTGSKEQDPGQWLLNNGSQPSKSDILHSAYATETVHNSTTNLDDLFFYGAFQRAPGSGDANLDFELNAIPGTFDNDNNAATPPVPIRSEGDLLITFDGNASGGIAVGMCIWHGDKFGESSNAPGASAFGWYTLPGFGNGGTKLKGSGTCTTLSTVQNPTAIGAMNVNQIENDDTPGAGGTIGIPNFSNPIGANQFGETAVNLTEALANAGVASPCLDFGSVWMHSRSSSAPLSNMQDYVGPMAIQAASGCAINLKKYVAVQKPGGPTPLFPSDYSDADTPAGAVFASNGDTLNYVVQVTNPGANPLTLDTDPPTDTKCTLSLASKVDKNGVADASPTLLNPGDVWTYTCTHPYAAGDASLYTNVSDVIGHQGNPPPQPCTDQSPLPCVHHSDPANVKRNGTITIVKDRLPGTSADGFDFTTSADLQAQGANNFTLHDDGVQGHNTTSFDVVPNDSAGGGTYTVSEALAAANHYDLTDLTCTGNGQGGSTSVAQDAQSGTATIVVGSGQSVTCTFTNTKQAHLTIVKQSVPAGSSHTFDFTTTGLNGAAPTLDATGGAGSTTDFWIPASQFGAKTVDETAQAGWDLTNITGCTGATFGSNPTYAHNSFTAGDLGFSLTVGAGSNVTCTFTNTQRGSVAIHKTAIGGSGTFDYTTNSAGVTNINNLQDGTTSTPQSVAPGSYTFTETPKTGWDLTNITCDDSGQAAGDKSTFSVQNGTATFNVQPGENVICTYTNTKRGSVAIHKTAIGGSGTFDYTTNSAGVTNINNLQDGTTSTAQSVAPGSYTFAEAAKAGWDLTAISCDDSGQANPGDRSTTNLNAGTATFNVQPGENVICTYTNTKRGSVAIHKTAIGGSGTFDYTANSQGVTDINNLQDGTTSTPQSVVPGSYTFTEAQKAGWDLTSITCDDSGQAAGDKSTFDVNARTATFNVQPGENVICTYTNTKRATLAIHKTTLGGSGTFDYTTSDAPATDISNLQSGTTSSTQSVPPGNYTYAETAQAGWDLTALSCDDSGQQNAGDRSTTDLNAGTATFNLQPGENVICTFTNTKRASVSITKVNQGGDPNDSFSFNASSQLGNDFSEKGGETKVFNNVVPDASGAYTVEEAVPNGYRLESIHCVDSVTSDSTDVTNPDAPKSGNTVTTATIKVQPGEDVHCTFTNKAIHSAIKVVKTGPGHVYHGDTMVFGYTVTNEGDGPLTDITLSDDKCPNVTGPDKGNDASPNTLDPGDVWTYTCSTPVPAHSSGEENPIVNTATVGGKDEFNQPVSDTDKHSTQILHPAIKIDKQGPATANQGDTLHYTLIVTNPGDEPLGNVTITDQQCPNVSAPNKGNDASPSTLDPGDSWTYTCDRATTDQETSVTNEACVAGTDQFGRTVNDCDQVTTGLQAVLGQEVNPGSAKLAGKTGCVARKFFATVTGKQIVKVVFTVDGKKKKTVTKPDSKGRFKYLVDPNKFKPGSHLLVATSTFDPSSQTNAKQLRLRFARCVRRTQPAFTG